MDKKTQKAKEEGEEKKKKEDGLSVIELKAKMLNREIEDCIVTASNVVEFLTLNMFQRELNPLVKCLDRLDVRKKAELLRDRLSQIILRLPQQSLSPEKTIPERKTKTP